MKFVGRKYSVAEIKMTIKFELWRPQYLEILIKVRVKSEGLDAQVGFDTAGSLVAVVRLDCYWCF